MKWSHNFALNNYQPLTDFSTVDLNCAGSNNGLGEISTTIFLKLLQNYFLFKEGYRMAIYVSNMSLEIMKEVLLLCSITSL